MDIQPIHHTPRLYAPIEFGSPQSQWKSLFSCSTLSSRCCPLPFQRIFSKVSRWLVSLWEKLTGQWDNIDPKRVEFFLITSHGNPELTFRLIYGGEATENEVRVRRGEGGFFQVELISFPNKKLLSQLQSMLRYILATEKGKGFIAFRLSEGKTLWDAGFRTEGTLKFYSKGKGLDTCSIQIVLLEAESQKGGFSLPTLEAFSRIQEALKKEEEETIVYPADEENEEEELIHSYHLLPLKDLLTVMEKIDLPPLAKAASLRGGTQFVLPG